MRYFFHVRDKEGIVADEEGSELPNLVAARQEARECAKDFVVDVLRGGPSVVSRHIDISDAAGTILETLPLISVLH